MPSVSTYGSCIDLQTLTGLHFAVPRYTEEQANVQEAAPASFLAGRVWQLSELELLEESSIPAIVLWIKYPVGR